MDTPLLSVSGLRTWFITDRGVGRAVDDVGLTLEAGRTMAVVGESGCGKTVLALSLLGLIQPPGKVVAGRAVFEGRDLLALSEAELRTVRGARASMIFQEPMTSLNPVLTVGEQVAEAVRVHRKVPAREALDRAEALFARVGLPDPRRRLGDYPHELSGGMRQRVMIAMALALEPALLLADEPTTALDVTVQRQILDLMLEMTGERGASVLLITHNLGVVAETCDQAMVMYAGRAVENAPVADLFREPLHPYTLGLLGSLPRPGSRARLAAIPGSVPALGELPRGCHFHPRCDRAFERCRVEVPPLFTRDRTLVRCWLYA